MNPLRWRSSVLLSAALALSPLSAAGQDGASSANTADSETFQVVGIVVDRRSGEPVSAAKVEFVEAGTGGEAAWTGQSDASGRFVTQPLQVGGYEIKVEAVAYSAVSHLEIFLEAAVMDLRIEVVRVDYELEPLIVSARRENRLERTGFYRRQMSGVGHYITLAEIEARQAYDVSELFRAIPGARVSPETGIYTGGDVRLRGGCTPQVVVDGVSLLPPVRMDQLFQPGDLEAVEVYHGPTAPIEYNGRSTCGTIMVWTRSPPEPTGHTISFKKMAVIVGFTTLAVFTTSR